jgi:hypothetical protein
VSNSYYRRDQCRITADGPDRCRVTWCLSDSDQWFFVKGDLRQSFRCRYLPEVKCWLVYASVSEVQRWALGHFAEHEIEVERDYWDYGRRSSRRDYQHQRQQSTRAPSQLETAYEVLHLRPTAPPELVASAHRVMARLSHPDTGGSHEAAVKVNAAFETIMAARR